MKLIVHYTDGKSWTFNNEKISYDFDGLNVIIEEGESTTKVIDKAILELQNAKQTFIPEEIVAGLEIHHDDHLDDIFGHVQGHIEIVRLKKNFSVKPEVVRKPKPEKRLYIDVSNIRKKIIY